MSDVHDLSDDDKARRAWLRQPYEEESSGVITGADAIASARESFVDQEEEYHTFETYYRASLTARFPDEQSMMQAEQSLREAALPANSRIQSYRADDPTVTSQLDSGEAILILQLGRGPVDREALIKLIESAGGVDITFTPAQLLTNRSIEESEEPPHDHD